jgi:hypothetical protein
MNLARYLQKSIRIEKKILKYTSHQNFIARCIQESDINWRRRLCRRKFFATLCLQLTKTVVPSKIFCNTLFATDEHGCAVEKFLQHFVCNWRRRLCRVNKYQTLFNNVRTRVLLFPHSTVIVRMLCVFTIKLQNYWKYWFLPMENIRKNFCLNV